jgi:serine/threonine protein kinase
VADTKLTGGVVPTRAERFRVARALASPLGVVITLPLLVAAAGVGIVLLGRDATRGASDAMARHELAAQATNVQSDVAFALDQAQPLLAQLAVLADRAQPAEAVLPRLHELLVGRPGVGFVSISFEDGTFRGAELEPDGSIEVQESAPGERTRYAVEAGALRVIAHEAASYDPRTRAFYLQAAHAGARVWTEPYTFYRTHDTGITCAQPFFDARRQRAGVLTVDFHVRALSSFVSRPALDEARSIMFTRDGTVLAYPEARDVGSDRLLRATDLHDAALEALLAQPAGDALRFTELATRDGAYLASVAPIGGKRAGVAVPLDWYVATVVPARTLLGPTHRLERSASIASAGAIAIAIGLALVLAWNLVRMRRQVAASREEARTAQTKARELGSYRLVARLGAGGMGEVWRAEHRLLARSAAIKLIRAEAMQDEDGAEEVRERFRREAQTLASMKSRHTIEIFDYGVAEDGVFFYVMELLDGLDLESVVLRYGPQPAARVIGMLVQACASLAEAHDAGLLHRDIKPPNLVVCRAADEVDIVKLLDFGIVQTAGSEDPARGRVPQLEIPETPKLTRAGATLGTPGFMAPEQILGMQLDGRSDLYALGCIAWWLLTGRELFAREAGEAKLHRAHIYDELPRLRELAPGWIPDELEAVLAACLAKEPDARPADARVLAARLRAIAIPAEQAWTEARASAWWRDYLAPAPAPNVPAREVQLVVPR